LLCIYTETDVELEYEDSVMVLKLCIKDLP